MSPKRKCRDLAACSDASSHGTPKRKTGGGRAFATAACTISASKATPGLQIVPFQIVRFVRFVDMLVGVHIQPKRRGFQLDAQR